MNEIERATLKSYYFPGARPSAQQFWDLIDACANLAEENDNNLRLTGSIRVGDHHASNPPMPGTIRYNPSTEQFEGFIGGGTNSFQPLGSGGGVSNPLTVGTARMGTYSGGNPSLSNSAVFAHQNQFGGTGFAFAQGPSGVTVINSGGGNPITFANNETPNMVIQNGVVTIGNPPGSGTTLLRVYGNAEKPGGGTWGNISDIRMKRNICEFSDGLDVIKLLKPVKYQYKREEESNNDPEYVGLIAQDVQEVAPYTVSSRKAKISPDEEETDLLIFDSSALLYVAINAIKELDAEVRILRNQLEKFMANSH